MIGTVFYPLSRVITAVVVFFTSIFGGAGMQAALGQAPPGLDPLPYPAWVHTHWVWEHDGTQQSTIDFVESFKSRDIPVGVVDVEPRWSTALTTYAPDAALFPDMRGMIDHFHAQGTKVLLWTTCMLNEDAETFAYAKEKGYLVSNGSTVKWWNGTGAFIDYTNPEAVQWWHEQMDIVLDMGVDGWKVDGAEPYIVLQIPSWGKGGPISWARYKKLMYDDFYNYTREKTGGKGIAWARPTDDTMGLGLPITFMPRDKNFVGWVGDQDNDWGGLRGAMNQMFTSSLFNYVSYGSDIGGFRSTPAKPDPEDVFLRWAQLGAFCPIMENGGGGEHRPWMYDEMRDDGKTYVTDIYRKFVNLHYDLIPYISSQVAYSYERNQPTMRPTFGLYQYMLGDEIFVAPFYEEGNERTIVFPGGEWIYLFDQSKIYTSGIQTLNFPLNEFPVFIRKGAIIPTQGIDDEFTTVSIYPKTGTNQFGLYEQDVKGAMLSYTKSANAMTFACGATGRDLLLRICGEAKPVNVGPKFARAGSLEELKGMAKGYFYDSAAGELWVLPGGAAAGGVEVKVEW